MTDTIFKRRAIALLKRLRGQRRYLWRQFTRGPTKARRFEVANTRAEIAALLAPLDRRIEDLEALIGGFACKTVKALKSS